MNHLFKAIIAVKFTYSCMMPNMHGIKFERVYLFYIHSSCQEYTLGRGGIARNMLSY